MALAQLTRWTFTPIMETHVAWLNLSTSDEQGACPRLLALFFLYQPNLKDYCGA